MRHQATSHRVVTRREKSGGGSPIVAKTSSATARTSDAMMVPNCYRREHTTYGGLGQHRGVWKPTSSIGPSATSLDVRCLVAFGGKADEALF